MTEPLSHIDLAMARVVHTATDLVEVHIRPDTRIDIAGIRAALEARRHMLGGRKGGLIFFAEGDLDWERAALQTDLFGADAYSITSMGVLVTNKVLAMAANTYFGLFPPPFPTRVDNDLLALCEWQSEVEQR